MSTAIRVLALLCLLAATAPAQDATRPPAGDGIELRKAKADCPCGVPLDSAPHDGRWCSPWLKCPPPEPEPQPNPAVTTLSVSTVVTVIGLTVDSSGGLTGGGVGNPLDPDPPISIRPKSAKPAGSGTAASLEDSDTPFLVGPDIDLVLGRNVTDWDITLSLYARALFGTFETFGVKSDVELYSLGPRLWIPLLNAGDLRLGAQISAGPAWLRTDIGDATGFDAGAGLRADYAVSRHLSLLAALEANGFVSDNLFTWGPALNFGFNLSW